MSILIISKKDIDDTMFKIIRNNEVGSKNMI